MYADIPINKNRIFHTIGNTHPGGENGGWYITEYWYKLSPDSIELSKPMPNVTVKITANAR